MKYLKFTLSMPGRNSWNGRWSGEGREYNIVTKVATKKKQDLASELVSIGYFDYNFGDGWRAAISVEEIDGKQARAARKNSRGFCGYDWMVDSILRNKEIKC